MSKLLETPAAWQQAWIDGEPAVSSFYRNAPFDWSVGVQPVGAWESLGNNDVAEWREYLRPHVADAGLLAPLDLLTRPEALVVVTGQQAGAVLGPLYALHKALGAVRLARDVGKATGRPVVPIFWVASDDHDIAEVRDAVWLAQDSSLQRADLAPDSARGDASVWQVPIDQDKAAAFLDRLRNTTNSSEFREGLMCDLRDALGEGATFESQFVALACRWLLPLGIVPLVPRLGFMRRRAAPLLRRELSPISPTNRIVSAQRAAIEALGGKPLLHRRGEELNFFIDLDGVRAAVSRRADGIIVARSPLDRSAVIATWSESELLSLLDQAPERFSPNAILRPLVQDMILPTVAYVGGPGEILYHAQLGPIYTEFGVHRAALIPRPSAALLDTKTLRALNRVGLEPASLSAGIDPTQTLGVAVEADPTMQAIGSRVSDVKMALARLQSVLAEQLPDQAVLRSMEKLKGAADQGLERLTERVTAAISQRDEDRVRAVDKIRASLFPEGVPQERLVSPLTPLLINYGPKIIRALCDALEINTGSVQPIVLSELTRNLD